MKNVFDWSLEILNTADPEEKANLTEQLYKLWLEDKISIPLNSIDNLASIVPTRPARDENRVKIVPAGAVPRRGKGGSLASRQALLHSLVHIECSAIDLAIDIIARFVFTPRYINDLPLKEFLTDWITVAADEARHFRLLLQRLRETGKDYGDLPAHGGLWESAEKTSHSLPARLAIEHACHEARGLDILPQTISRFRNGGDEESALLLETVIFPEEISHCAAGVKWLIFLHTKALSAREKIPNLTSFVNHQSHQNGRHENGGENESETNISRPTELSDWALDALEYPDGVEFWFHSLVRRYFRGNLKPPFNDDARAKAGFKKTWYYPLVEDAIDVSV